MTTRIKLRRDTAANWLEANPILAAGEPGLETDTGKVKYGDGETAWSTLAYGGETLNKDGNVVITAGNTAHWLATQRRNDQDTVPKGIRYDSTGNLYTLTGTYDGNDQVTVITKYTATGAIAWQKSIDDAFAVSLAIDSADNCYVVIYDNNDLQIFKFSTSGTVTWKKNYSVGYEIWNGFIEEQTDNSLVFAATYDDDDNANQVTVFKISAVDGAVIARRILNNQTGSFTMEVGGIDVDGNGNVYITGRFYNNSQDKDKMFIEKLDINLDRIWSKSLETDTGYSMNGGDCASDDLGNVYAVGWYNVNTITYDGNSSQTAAILTKLNSTGVVQWTRRIGPGPCGSMVAGLTATATGDVYMSAMTFEYKRDREMSENTRNAYGSNKAIVARYDTTGAVIWQRYVDIPTLYENFNEDTYRGQAIAVYDDRFAVDIWGNSSNTEVFNFSDTADNEADYFVVQLPTDGTETTIGDLKFTASRVPGKFVTHVASDATSVITNAAFTDALTITNSSKTLDELARVANATVRAGSYDYTFGIDGTLTIPNDGDIRLTQSQIGFLSVIGGEGNSWGSDIRGRAVAVDSEGAMYVTGKDLDSDKPFVVKFDAEGFRIWGVVIRDDEDGTDGTPNGIGIDPATGNIQVVCERYGGYVFGTIHTLDSSTGRVLTTKRYRDNAADVYLTDIAYTQDGNYVVAGSKFGEFVDNIAAVPQTGSGANVIVLSRSISPADPSQWQIGGDGIANPEYFVTIDNYTGLSGTTRQGSGATFNVEIDGSGNITSVTPAAGGTNYLAGHKITLPYTAFDGIDNNADIILTVLTLGAGGSVASVSYGYSGGGGGAPGTYNAVSGTNRDVGSGFVLNFGNPRNTTNYADYDTFSIVNSGSNYVNNDVIVIPGTSLGGTSPANDLTLTVQADSGQVTGILQFAGTSQSTYWKLTTNSAVDFSQPGSWYITYPLSRESFLATPTWQRTFGTDEGDYEDNLIAVSVDSGNNIIAVGRGYGQVQVGDEYQLAMVYKFNSTGTLQWARKLNDTNYDCTASGVATVGTDIYVIHYNTDNTENIVTKLSADGTVKWQRVIEGREDGNIAAAPDGNVLVALQAYNDDINDDAFKIFKLTPSGDTVYKRWLSSNTGDDVRLQPGRALVTDAASFYITSESDTNDSDVAMAVKLPLDGSGVGEYGQFRYTDVNAMTGSFSDGGLSGTNYSINEKDLEQSFAGALTKAPYVETENTMIVSNNNGGWFYVDSFEPVIFSKVVRDTDGGRIVFADGTTQNTSATDIPQQRFTGQKYTLGLQDRGHHILCTDTGDNITIPYNARVEFPIGTAITIVNDAGGTVYIYQEGSSLQVILAGDGTYYGFQLASYGIATLLKIGRDRWIISGNVTPD